MTKDNYMALADVQAVWTNSIKPWVIGNFNKSFIFDENAQATSTTPPSVTASATTMGKIYLVGPATGTKYQWITEEDSSTTPSTYSWQQIGTTDINLQYASEQDVRGIVSRYQAGA